MARISRLFRGFMGLFVSGLEERNPEALMEAAREDFRSKMVQYNMALAQMAGVAERLKIQFINEDVDDAHGVVFADIVVETLGQQNNLLSIFAFDESLHGHLAENGCRDFI